MIEITGKTTRNMDQDAFDFTVTVGAMQIRVANSQTRKQELAHRVGELAMSLANDFLQQLADSEEYDGA